MKSYTDANGRAIHLRLDVLAIRRVKEHAKIDLTAIEATDATGQPLLTQLAGLNIELLVDVLWAIAQPAMEQAGVSPMDFAAGLTGKALGEAQKALFEELLDFFRELNRTDLVRQIQAVLALVRKGITKSTALAEAMELQVGQEIDALDLPAVLSPAATRSEASSDSTPDHSLFQN